VDGVVLGGGVEEREKRRTSSTNAFTLRTSRNKRRLITCNKMTCPCASATVRSTSIIITSART
jgi:hypothetical protein